MRLHIDLTISPNSSLQGLNQGPSRSLLRASVRSLSGSPRDWLLRHQIREFRERNFGLIGGPGSRPEAGTWNRSTTKPVPFDFCLDWSPVGHRVLYSSAPESHRPPGQWRSSAAIRIAASHG
jgi:hypothetical protein